MQVKKTGHMSTLIWPQLFCFNSLCSLGGQGIKFRLRLLFFANTRISETKPQKNPSFMISSSHERLTKASCFENTNHEMHVALYCSRVFRKILWSWRNWNTSQTLVLSKTIFPTKSKAVFNANKREMFFHNLWSKLELIHNFHLPVGYFHNSFELGNARFNKGGGGGKSVPQAGVAKDNQKAPGNPFFIWASIKMHRFGWHFAQCSVITITKAQRSEKITWQYKMAGRPRNRDKSSLWHRYSPCSLKGAPGVVTFTVTSPCNLLMPIVGVPLMLSPLIYFWFHQLYIQPCARNTAHCWRCAKICARACRTSGENVHICPHTFWC